MKGILPWLVRWACLAGTRDFCSPLAALVGQVQNIFCTLFRVPIAQQPGQAAVLGGLSLSMYLWSRVFKSEPGIQNIKKIINKQMKLQFRKMLYYY
jgi:hypothetical protein